MHTEIAEEHRQWAAEAIESPRGNLSACMWVKRELDRKMTGFTDLTSLLIQFGGSIEEYDTKVAELNKRLAFMRPYVEAVLALKGPRKKTPT